MRRSVDQRLPPSHNIDLDDERWVTSDDYKTDAYAEREANEEYYEEEEEYEAEPIIEELDEGEQIVSNEEVEASPDLLPFPIEKIHQAVTIKHTQRKGRCLYTRKDLNPGDIIFIESPVLVAVPSLNPDLWSMLSELNDTNTMELPPVWHLAAICSLTMLEQRGRQIIADKWVPDANKAPSDDVIRVLQHTRIKLDPREYERFLQAWRYNSFGHHTESDGLVLYNCISMMAHSCGSTACWHYGEDDAFVLRARQRLRAGDELTISYIGDEDLFKSTLVRREKLSSWLFSCQCERCETPFDLGRGFRCPACGVGTISFTANGDVTVSTKCDVCYGEMTDEQIQDYMGFEDAYVARLEETGKDDLQDAELVFSEAQRVFKHHWVMFSLHTILFEAYRDKEMWEEASMHQQKRRDYVSFVMPKATYTLAWLNEELGDAISNSINTKMFTDTHATLSLHQKNTLCRLYEDAMNILLILCGDSHDYTLAAYRKLERISQLPESPSDTVVD